MTPLSTPIFESEALQRLRLLRQWKLNLTEFASTLKFVESGLINYAQSWEDV